jgi:4-nitrophenyl phosphatase
MRGTVICDLDGVLFVGSRPIPGAGEALSRLAEQGYDLLFCTNNSYRTVGDLVKRIRALVGFPAEAEQVVGSAEAAARLLAGRVERAYVLGGEGITEALASVGVDQVDEWTRAQAVVVGLDRDLDYDRLAAAVLAVSRGALLVATNEDPTWPGPEGLYPGAGAILAAVETATGRTAEVAGKPRMPMRDALKTRIRSEPVWVVGDRPETDLAMAKAEGWKGVLVLTGVVQPGQDPDPAPDHVLDSIADLPELLDQTQR